MDSQNLQNPDHGGSLMRAAIECGIVTGLSLFCLFYLIPTQTSGGSNFGLSSSMLPTVCASAIALASVAQFFISILKRPRRDNTLQSKGLATVGALIIAAILGIAGVHYFGLTIGGTLLVVMSSAVIGIRRLLPLAAMGCAAAILLTFVVWSGL